MLVNPFSDFIEVKDKGTRGRIFLRNKRLRDSCIDMIIAVPREVHIINLEKQDDTMLVKVVGRAGGKEFAVVVDDTLEELAGKLNAHSITWTVNELGGKPSEGFDSQ